MRLNTLCMKGGRNTFVHRSTKKAIIKVNAPFVNKTFMQSYPPSFYSFPNLFALYWSVYGLAHPPWRFELIFCWLYYTLNWPPSSVLVYVDLLDLLELVWSDPQELYIDSSDDVCAFSPCQSVCHISEERSPVMWHYFATSTGLLCGFSLSPQLNH